MMGVCSINFARSSARTPVRRVRCVCVMGVCLTSLASLHVHPSRRAWCMCVCVRVPRGNDARRQRHHATSTRHARRRRRQRGGGKQDHRDRGTRRGSGRRGGGGENDPRDRGTRRWGEHGHGGAGVACACSALSRGSRGLVTRWYYGAECTQRVLLPLAHGANECGGAQPPVLCF